MKIRSAPRVPRVRRLPRACTGQARGPLRRAQLCPCPLPRPLRGERGRGLPPCRGRVPSWPCSAPVPLRAAKEANARERREPSPVCVAGLPGAPPRDGAAPTPLTRPRPDARPSPWGARRLQQGTHGLARRQQLPRRRPTHKSHGGGALVRPGCPLSAGCSPAAHALLSAVGHVAGALAHCKPRGGRALRPGPSGATAEGPRPPHPGWAGTRGCAGARPHAGRVPGAWRRAVSPQLRGCRSPSHPAWIGAPWALPLRRQDPRPLVAPPPPRPPPGPAFSEPFSRCGGAPCARWRGRPRLVRAAPRCSAEAFSCCAPLQGSTMSCWTSLGNFDVLKEKKKKKS